MFHILLPFCTVLLSYATLSCTLDLNVGTVLFTKADLSRECWSSENLALLTSRMILEDLLPNTSILVIDSNEFITDLVEYFRLILETVRSETHGKIKHLTLMALTDLLGGYLHHAVLPIAKFSYYAGIIDYDSMATLLGLFDELKWFLRTNGQGWSKPLHQTLDNLQIQNLPLEPCNDNNVCENLILVEGEMSTTSPKSSHNDITIPLPFFDSVTQPHAIALPTKLGPLYSVEANSSSSLVMNFFVTAYQCLQVKNVRAENVAKFEDDFCDWIDDQILPRLEDEKFYAAFGGILRVRNTIKKFGMTSNESGKLIDNLQHPTESTQVNQQGTHQMSTSAMILTASLITIFIWFLLGTLFICFKIKHSRDNEEEGGKSTGTSITSSKACTKDDSGKCKGGYRHQITIKTCNCDEREAGSPSSRSTTPTDTNHSNRTGSRLPSITEMSEATTSTPKKPVTTPADNKTTARNVTTLSSPEEDETLRRISSLKLYEDTSESEEEESSPE